eukprot:12717856-Alexandrium_andersonii.AAC.1
MRPVSQETGMTVTATTMQAQEEAQVVNTMHSQRDVLSSHMVAVPKTLLRRSSPCNRRPPSSREPSQGTTPKSGGQKDVVLTPASKKQPPRL